jgi:hypothetical protein
VIPVARSGAADLIGWARGQLGLFLLLLQLRRSELRRLGRTAISFNKAVVSIFLARWICGGNCVMMNDDV